jgi:hypothetical protein
MGYILPSESRPRSVEKFDFGCRFRSARYAKFEEPAYWPLVRGGSETDSGAAAHAPHTHSRSPESKRRSPLRAVSAPCPPCPPW